MGARIRTARRKEPRQARSRATVDAILQATEKVLVKEGYEHASTNRVAAEAGVSVGSLYQYFPSKEALVCAVMERHCEEMLKMVEGSLAELESARAPLEVVANVLVRQMIAVHRLNPRLHKVLIEQVPRIGRLAKLDQMLERIGELIAGYLSRARADVEVDDVELASFVLVTAVEALTHKAVSQRPELLENGDFERHLAQLCLRFVAPSRTQALERRRVRAEAASTA